jgi:DNA repair protein SbcD/Mre11
MSTLGLALMRFLHAADIHLDSPLRGLDDYEGAPTQVLRGAARKALTTLVQLALSERVEFVIFAGDLYDGDWPDYSTGQFFVNRVRELDEAGIPVIILNGNHDAASRITPKLTLPTNVHALPTTEPGTKLFDHLRVAVHGQGFARQAETRNLAVNYPAPVPGYFNIGVLHTALDGREGHAPYAPCTINDLAARGYDYWALGHIHKRESANGTQHPRIEFPGNIQGRHARETGAKGCLIVAVDHYGNAIPEFRPLDVVRWEVLSVDAPAAESISDVLEAARAVISDARDGSDGRTLAVRVIISCSEAMSFSLEADQQVFAADLRSQAGGDVWIEKIKFAPIRAEETEIPALSEDAASELRAVLAELRSHPDEARAVFTSGECGKLVNGLPADLRDAFEQSWDDVFARASGLLQASPSEPAK